MPHQFAFRSCGVGWRAIRRAPADSVTLTMAGSSSGDRPTASATANSSDSTSGLCSRRLMVSTNSTITIMTRVRRKPNWRNPCVNSVSGDAFASRPAILPNSVRSPVPTIKTSAVPLLTEVPMNTQFERCCSDASASTSPGLFSTGKDSPVRAACETRKSRHSRITPSAGTRLPAASLMTSPGTTRLASIDRTAPSRIAVTLSAKLLRKSAMAADARYSWVKARIVLPATISRMIAASVHCLRASETMAPKMRMRTSGLSNWRNKSRAVVIAWRTATEFSP